MTRFRQIMLLCVVLVMPVLHAGEPDPGRVIVVANDNMRGSLEVARHYMERRGIPSENLIRVNASSAEKITWDEFTSTLYNPLLAILTAEGWIDATVSEQRDDVGRLIYPVYSHKIEYLVLCYGVPVKIEHDADLTKNREQAVERNEFKKNYASVDTELALLCQSKTPVIGYVGNPLFGLDEPGAFTLNQVVRVARLDGPDVDSVNKLVDNAIAAEQFGIIGRGYIDKSGKYPQGDQWLDVTAGMIQSLDFPCQVDAEKELIRPGERFDVPAFYFGWWSAVPQGPIARKDFRFPPGAVAMHIYSFSASTIREPNKVWVAPLVSKGVTATVGNVYEPYLQLTHYPQYMMKALLDGKTFGEAAYYSLPVLSWQSIAVGDPLYRPFVRSLDWQMEHLAELPRDLAPYVVIRKMNRLVREGRAAEAAQLGVASHDSYYGIALAFRTAQILYEIGEIEQARKLIDGYASLPVFTPGQQPIAADLCEYLVTIGQNDLALKLYRVLLDDTTYDVEFARLVLPNAVAFAKRESYQSEAARWTQYLEHVQP